MLNPSDHESASPLPPCTPVGRTPEPERTTGDGVPSETDDQSRAIGAFAGLVEECRVLLADLVERVDDHLGLSPDDVLWGHVADAERLLEHLREAAFVAGFQDEPGPG